MQPAFRGERRRTQNRGGWVRGVFGGVGGGSADGLAGAPHPFTAAKIVPQKGFQLDSPEKVGAVV